MNLSISIPKKRIDDLRSLLERVRLERVIVAFAVFLSITATIYFLKKDLILAYGDAESHLNIAKRVVNGLTPGFAQLGGIWLPLPHIFMIPFVWFDPLWRSGLGGSIVAGVCYVITALYLFKMGMQLTGNKYMSALTSLLFATNPNILYLQSTPMSEMVLIVFFILSSYYFIEYIRHEENLAALIVSGFFGFCAVLTRYDGWFLVAIEALTIVLLYFHKKEPFKNIEGKVILFSTLAFFGIALWMAWDFLILGDAFYFTNSQFSAHAQQLSWLMRGELPAYHNVFLSIAYYFVTSMSDSGVLLFLTALVGLILFLRNHQNRHRYFFALVFLVPFIFNVFTLFMGQSVIFIPHLTPVGFEWRLFNVRYGVLMIPIVSLFFAYVFYKARHPGLKLFILVIIFMQFGLYTIGYSKLEVLSDGTQGLSQAKRPDAEYFVKNHYDHGLILVDDYARTMSIIRSGIPMQDVIYIGTKPYWEVSLVAPERYARWIIMQKNDEVWKAIYDKPDVRGRLYKYFQKVYTSPNILIFKRIT